MQKILTFFNAEFKDNKSPWGTRKPSGNGGTRRRAPEAEQADIEDVIRAAQDRMRGMMGSGGGGSSSGGFNGGIATLAISVLFVVWVSQSVYKVDTDEEGVVTRFGKYIETTGEGLHFMLWPIENVVKPKVTRENIVEVGFRGSRSVRSSLGSRSRRELSNDQIINIPQESLMLTGDENIVDLNFTVRWKIADSKDYLFNVANPDDAIKHVAESAMREVIGRYPIDDAITYNKLVIQQETSTLIQEIMDLYRMGVQINGVELQQVTPPREVMDAFRDVQAAKADAEKIQDQAVGYANDIVPRARGQAAQIMQEAEAYKASKVAEATGAAQRFESQLIEYRKAKDVTTKRLYLETMQRVMQNTKKVVVGTEAGKGILPYLPLGDMKPTGRAK